MNRRALAVLGCIAIGLCGALIGLGTHATYGARLSADEPQYVLTAISLAEDGNLDIADELADERWRSFHGAELPTQTAVLADGRQVSPHDPLLPLLLAPAVWVTGQPRLGARLTMVGVAGALAGLTFWTARVRFNVRPRVAAIVVGVFSLSMPLAPYGTQIYPELPAAVLVVAAVALLTGPPRTVTTAATVLTLILLPWLAVKYAPVAAALGVVAVMQWRRAGRNGAVVGALLTAAAAGMAWVLIHQAVWTGTTAYASAELFAGAEFSAVGFSPNLVGRARRLSGLLIGRDFGLASWQPAWLVIVPALTALTIRRAQGCAVLVWPFVTGWLVATFVALTMQGWWSPGRQIVVVLPLAVIAVAQWAQASGRRMILVAVLGLLGIQAWVRLAWETTREQLTLIVDFFNTQDPVLGLWRTVLPAYLRMDRWGWTLHVAWTLALVGLIVVTAQHERRSIQEPTPAART